MASQSLLRTARVASRTATAIPVRNISYSVRLLQDSPSSSPSHDAQSQQSPNKKLDTSSLINSLNSNTETNLDFSKKKPKEIDPDIASLLADLKAGTTFASNLTGRRGARGSMTQPVPYKHPTVVHDLFAGPSSARNLKPDAPSPVALGPRLGKSSEVDVYNGVDVAKAFNNVEAVCMRNKVKREAAMQRFHERPGLKRKRLHKERWRRRFKENFRQICQRVMELRRQGW